MRRALYRCATTSAQANRCMLKLVIGPKDSSPDLAVTPYNSSFGKVLWAVSELKLKCLGVPGFETDRLEKIEIIVFEEPRFSFRPIEDE